MVSEGRKVAGFHCPSFTGSQGQPFLLVWLGGGHLVKGQGGDGHTHTHSLTKTQALHLLPHPQAPRVNQGTRARGMGWYTTPCGHAELTGLTTAPCLQRNSPHLRPTERGRGFPVWHSGLPSPLLRAPPRFAMADSLPSRPFLLHTQLHPRQWAVWQGLPLPMLLSVCPSSLSATSSHTGLG